MGEDVYARASRARRKWASGIRRYRAGTHQHYFPEELGGLALQNPLIELSAKMLVKTRDVPFEIVQKAWHGTRQRFDRLVERWDQAMLSRKSRGLEADEDNTFMTFQSFVRYAEETEPALCSAYSTLLEDLKGAEEDIGVELINVVQRVNGSLIYQRAATKSRSPLYWKRIVQLYGAEASENYGGLNMTHAGSLPMGGTGFSTTGCSTS